MNPDVIERAARQWIGTPFHHQASLMGVGCDCLGFIRGVYRQCGGVQSFCIPNYGLFWSERGQFDLYDRLSDHLHLIPQVDATVGDIVLLRMRFGGPPPTSRCAECSRTCDDPLRYKAWGHRGAFCTDLVASVRCDLSI